MLCRKAPRFFVSSTAFRNLFISQLTVTGHNVKNYIWPSLRQTVHIPYPVRCKTSWQQSSTWRAEGALVRGRLCAYVSHVALSQLSCLHNLLLWWFGRKRCQVPNTDSDEWNERGLYVFFLPFFLALLYYISNKEKASWNRSGLGRAALVPTWLSWNRRGQRSLYRNLNCSCKNTLLNTASID